MLGIVACGIAFGAPNDSPPVLTVCEALSDLGRYEGMTVIVIGRVVSSDEGAWLDQDCGREIVNGGRTFRPSISLAWAFLEFGPPPQLPSGFKWNRRALQEKLDQVRRTTHLERPHARHYPDRWFAVFGRFETHLPRKVGDLGVTNGFGHLSGSPAQLISPRDGFLRLKDR